MISSSQMQPEAMHRQPLVNESLPDLVLSGLIDPNAGTTNRLAEIRTYLEIVPRGTLPTELLFVFRSEHFCGNLSSDSPQPCSQ